MRTVTGVCGWLGVWLVAAALGGAGLAAAPAKGQESVVSPQADEDDAAMPFDPAGQASVRPDDFNAMVRILNLSGEQRAAAESLFKSYNEARQRASAKMSAFQRSLGEAYPRTWQDERYTKEWQAVSADYMAHGQKLRDAFVEDIKTLLTPEQEGRWPRLERAERRRTTLLTAMAVGARTDLVTLTARVLGSETTPPAVADLLDQYELEVDRAHEDMVKAGKEMQEKGEALERKMKAGEEMNMLEMISSGQEILAAQARSARGLREVNLKYLRKLGEELKPEQREEMEFAYYSDRGFAPEFDVMARGAVPAASLFERASALPDLTADQRGRLASVRAEFRRESLVVLRRRFEHAVQQEERQSKGGVLTMFGGMFGGEGKRLADEAEKVNARAVENLRGLLTDEQLERMPPPLKKVRLERPRFDEP
ncbi:MAG: hypothetical protein IBJ11_05070 [Phycisphaerales bacterium]|nr:hypothetical protein [Phycisphaerales bacterium]